jgi:type II secretion system protein N
MADTPTWRRRLLRGGGYLTLALAVYLLALWQLLPYEEMGRRLEAVLRARGIGAEVRGLGPGNLLGCTADTLTLYPLDLPDQRWQLSGLDLRPLPRHLLRGDPAATLSGTFLGGRVEATALWQTPPRIDARWQNLSLAEVPLPPAADGLPLMGRVSGTLQADADSATLARGDGALEANLRDVAIGAGSVRGIPVPAVRLGDGALRVRTADGKMEVEAAEFQNGDLECSFTGSLILRDDLPRSLVNGLLTLRPNQQAAQDLALLFALFPGPKGSDGRYTARVRGSLGAPRLLKR